jgi:hypothetical protein
MPGTDLATGRLDVGGIGGRDPAKVDDAGVG